MTDAPTFEPCRCREMTNMGPCSACASRAQPDEATLIARRIYADSQEDWAGVRPEGHPMSTGAAEIRALVKREVEAAVKAERERIAEKVELLECLLRAVRTVEE